MSQELSSHILIIDDHAAIAKSMALALQSELPRFQLTAVSEVNPALRIIRERQPAAAVVDWRLAPARSGAEALTGSHLIRAGAQLSPGTKWVLFTAHPTSFVLKEAIGAGITGCVAKTAEYTELLRALVTVMDGKKYFCGESQSALAELATDLDLSATEREILRAVAAGLEPKEIADRAGLAVKTVYNTLILLRQKLGISSMVGLATFAVDRGIAPPSV